MSHEHREKEGNLWGRMGIKDKFKCFVLLAGVLRMLWEGSVARRSPSFTPPLTVSVPPNGTMI